MVDAAALVDEDWGREQAGESRIDGLPQDPNFDKHLSMQHGACMRSFLFAHQPFFFLRPDAPLILLSHIPL